MNAEARQRLQQAVQAKVDRLSKNPRIIPVIPSEELERGAWYVGSCWVCHVAMWDGEFFTTIKATGVGTQIVPMVPYASELAIRGGFIPYKRIPNPR